MLSSERSLCCDIILWPPQDAIRCIVSLLTDGGAGEDASGAESLFQELSRTASEHEVRTAGFCSSGGDLNSVTPAVSAHSPARACCQLQGFASSGLALWTSR